MIGNYRIHEEPLDNGDYGTLHSGYHEKRENEKVYIRILAQKVNRIKGLSEHLDIVKKLQETDNIVQLLEYGSNYTVSEFVRGVTLTTFIADKKMSDKAVLGLMRDIGAALHVLKNQSMDFKDLSADSIIVTFPSWWDFKTDGQDIANVRDSDLRFKLDVGVPGCHMQDGISGCDYLHYLSPKMLRGEPDPNSNIWSLGILAYRCLTGHMPFGKDNAVSFTLLTKYKSPNLTPEFPDGTTVAPAIKVLIGKMLKLEDRIDIETLFKETDECIEGTQKVVLNGYSYGPTDMKAHDYFGVAYVGTGVDDPSKKVLIKRLRVMKRSESELRAIGSSVKALNHANVISVLDYHVTSNDLILFMEPPAENTLDDFMKTKGPLPEVTIQNFLQQIGNGLKYLSDHQAVHKNLCPDVIRIEDGGSGPPRLTLADFCVPGQYPFDELTTKSGENTAFIACELLMLCEYDCEVDLWSAGVIAYFCLTGKVPFSAKTVLKYREIYCQDTTKFEIPTNTSKNFQDLLSRLLNPDPKDRMKLDEFLQHSFIKTKSIEAKKTTSPKAVPTTKTVEIKKPVDPNVPKVTVPTTTTKEAAVAAKPSAASRTRSKRNEVDTKDLREYIKGLGKRITGQVGGRHGARNAKKNDPTEICDRNGIWLWKMTEFDWRNLQEGNDMFGTPFLVPKASDAMLQLWLRPVLRDKTLCVRLMAPVCPYNDGTQFPVEVAVKVVIFDHEYDENLAEEKCAGKRIAKSDFKELVQIKLGEKMDLRNPIYVQTEFL